MTTEQKRIIFEAMESVRKHIATALNTRDGGVARAAIDLAIADLEQARLDAFPADGYLRPLGVPMPSPPPSHFALTGPDHLGAARPSYTIDSDLDADWRTEP